MELLGELLKQYYGTSAIYAAATYGLFAWLDNNASEEAKAALAATMKLKQYDRKQIASALVEVFDRIYSYPLFSLRSVVRSFLFSFIVTLIYVYEFQPSAFEAVRQIPSSKFDDLDKIDAYGALYMLFFNAATDYVALFVIRATLFA
jgi:hypothetical protein